MLRYKNRYNKLYKSLGISIFNKKTNLQTIDELYPIDYVFKYDTYCILCNHLNKTDHINFVCKKCLYYNQII